MSGGRRAESRLCVIMSEWSLYAIVGIDDEYEHSKRESATQVKKDHDDIKRRAKWWVTWLFLGRARGLGEAGGKTGDGIWEQRRERLPAQ